MAEDPAALVVAFTTSGSTGMPKLAAHSADAVVGHAVADAAAMGLRPGDTVLGALPLSGVFGYNAALAGLAAGATVLLEPVFDADAVLDAMARHRVTHVGAGDDMMLRMAQAAPRELPDWRWLGIADFQGRSREIAEWARDTHGVAHDRRVRQLRGVRAARRCGPTTTRSRTAGPAAGAWSGPTTEVRAVDPDTRAVLDPGSEGELEFRGPTVVDAYLGEPDRPTGDADGWFASGDLGVVTEPGVFTYTCRAGDALRLRGFLVDPAEIEVRLAEHPSVHTAKVVGVPDPDGATRAVAFVVGEPGAAPDPDALRAWCDEALARFKVPHAVRVLDEMPTTSGTNGTKIRAATLREWAAGSALHRASVAAFVGRPGRLGAVSPLTTRIHWPPRSPPPGWVTSAPARRARPQPSIEVVDPEPDEPAAPPELWPEGVGTGVGSMPGTDPAEASAVVTGETPDLPALPELPARGVGADMIGRTAGMLVDIATEVVPTGWRVTARAGRDNRTGDRPAGLRRRRVRRGLRPQPPGLGEGAGRGPVDAGRVGRAGVRAPGADRPRRRRRVRVEPDRGAARARRGDRGADRGAGARPARRAVVARRAGRGAADRVRLRDGARRSASRTPPTGCAR